MIVGISGASGTVYGLRALQRLRALGVETHLVMSRAAELTMVHETELRAPDIAAAADVVHAIGNIGAPIASGSFRTLGMLIAPCSIKTLGEIASGVTTTLLSRAADVVLKERRRLVLMVRETPLHLGHLRIMTQATEMGAIIMPPVPAMYARPSSIEAMVDQTVGRALDLFDLDDPSVRRWGETVGPKAGGPKG